MVKCVFCGKDEKEFIGIHFIKNDGSINYFCSSKCRKSSIKLHRDKRKIKWTEAYRIALAKSIEKVRKSKEKEDNKEKK